MSRGNQHKSYKPGSLSYRNVGEAEQWASLIAGGAVALYDLMRRSPRGLLLAAVGGAVAARGLTGHCTIYEAFGVSTQDEGRRKIMTSRATKVKHSITVNRPPEELYRFWRNFENLPRFMHHLESVTVMNGNRSRWVVKAPLGTTVSWDAEIINDKENELIGWQSLGGADVDNAGSVRFIPAYNGGTEVTVLCNTTPLVV